MFRADGRRIAQKSPRRASDGAAIDEEDGLPRRKNHQSLKKSMKFY
jgi:hypothetical protein